MTHLTADGQFQSDKYPTCPPGKVPLSCKDVTAQDLLWEYAQRRRSVDAEFSADLEQALRNAGYEPPALGMRDAFEECWHEPINGWRDAKELGWLVWQAAVSWYQRISSAFKPTHRHYKGGLYQKLLTGWHSETQEALTIYRNEAGAVWVRPTEMFEGEAPPSPGAGARPRQQRFEPLK
jgi:hypothetical protein